MNPDDKISMTETVEAIIRAARQNRNTAAVTGDAALKFRCQRDYDLLMTAAEIFTSAVERVACSKGN